MKDAEPGGELLGATVKGERGTTTFFADHFNLEPANAAADPRAECFGGGFFSSKTCSEAFSSIAFSEAVGKFRGSVDAREKSLAIAGVCAANASNFGEVNAGAENHPEYKLTYRGRKNHPDDASRKLMRQ